ncbi:HD domain-containing protein [Candidatus Woesearchaeota archaeon]|nr:HD domain-containing protein [Candidatus Woesearchaeota archaeon]
MNNLELLFEDVEDKWLGMLLNYCREQFEKVKLPSHNHLHHLRVWLNAKELFQELQKNNVEISKNDIEKAVIAIFFHDIGMVKTIEVEHGTVSRQMCESFFENNNLKKIEGFDEVLDAIQKHDEKEYRSTVYHGSLSPKNVLSVLCISDDLDAFGALGVFRYAEIYLLRNVPIEDLPLKVLKNLESRYKNFHNICYSHLSNFTKKQRNRYELTRKFYHDLEKELKENKYSKEIEFGVIGALNIFIREIIEGKTPILEISDKVFKTSNDGYTIKFFEQFKKEAEAPYKLYIEKLNPIKNQRE